MIIALCHADVKPPPSPPGRLERPYPGLRHPDSSLRSSRRAPDTQKSQYFPLVTPPPRSHECPPSPERDLTVLSTPEVPQRAPQVSPPSVTALPAHLIGTQVSKRDTIQVKVQYRMRWSPKFGHVIKSGFCSLKTTKTGGAGHETEPKETQPII